MLSLAETVSLLARTVGTAQVVGQCRAQSGVLLGVLPGHDGGQFRPQAGTVYVVAVACCTFLTVSAGVSVLPSWRCIQP